MTILEALKRDIDYLEKMHRERHHWQANEQDIAMNVIRMMAGLLGMSKKAGG